MNEETYNDSMFHDGIWYYLFYRAFTPYGAVLRAQCYPHEVFAIVPGTTDVASLSRRGSVMRSWKHRKDLPRYLNTNSDFVVFDQRPPTADELARIKAFEKGKFIVLRNVLEHEDRFLYSLTDSSWVAVPHSNRE